MVQNIIKWTYTGAVALLLMASCSREIGANGSGDADELSVTISLNVPGASTRALTDTQQEDVKYIDVLLFDKDLELVRWEKGVVEKSGGNTMFTVKLPVSATAADTYRMLVLANSNKTVYNLLGGANLGGHKGETYAQVRLLLEENAAGQGAYATDGIPMWGEFQTDFAIEKNMPAKTLTLLRSVARIDVGTNATIVTDPVTKMATYAKLDNFSLEEVYLYRANKSFMIMPERSKYSFSTYKVSGYSLPATVAKYDADDPQKYSGTDITRDNGTGISLIGSIYCPEADIDMKSGSGALFDDKHFDRMAVVVGGYFKPSGAASPNATLSYYRVDLTSGDATTSLHDILRNTCYQMVIKSVTGPGAPDPDEAYGSYVSQLEAVVIPYTNAPQNIVVDGQNEMKLTRDMIYCGSEGTTQGLEILCEITSTNTDVDLAVADATWEEGAGGWLTKDTHYTIGTTTTKMVDGKQVKHTTITVKDIPANTTGGIREARLLVRSGNMRYEYRIVQDGAEWLTAADDVFLLDGTIQSLDVDALTGWTVAVKDEGYNNIVNGENIIRRIVSNTGVAGTGEVNFQTLNDIFRTVPQVDKLQSVTLTFTHPDGYITKDVTIDFASGRAVDAANCYMTDGSMQMPVPVPVYAQVGRAITGVANQTNNAAAKAALPTGWLDGANLKAAVLWSDKPIADPRNAVVRSAKVAGAADPTTARLIVTPGAAQGNTVVILYDDRNGNDTYDGTDEIKWSWHIWNTDYNPNALATVPAANGPHTTAGMNGSVYRWNTTVFGSGATQGVRNNIIMDRHLGAADVALNADGTIRITSMNATADANDDKLHTFGLHYQWGRKDPFPPSASYNTDVERPLYGLVSSVQSEVITGSNNLTKSVKNPSTFFYRSNELSNTGIDWYTNDDNNTSQNSLLWGGTVMSDNNTPDPGKPKTVFDPCPAGWRVPIDGYGNKSFLYYGIISYESSDFPITWMNGYYFGTYPYSNYTIGWFPALGNRRPRTSELSSAGASSGFWSATPAHASSGGSGIRLSYNYGIHATHWYNSGSENRAMGLNIRCVAE